MMIAAVLELFATANPTLPILSRMDTLASAMDINNDNCCCVGYISIFDSTSACYSSKYDGKYSSSDGYTGVCDKYASVCNFYGNIAPQRETLLNSAVTM
eukprot:10018005-Ditylum_brightwellii.AAC.1